MIGTRLDELNADALDALQRLAATRPSPRSLIALWQLGGAPYLLTFDTAWTDPAQSSHCIEWTREAWAAMQRFSHGGSYLNFPGFGEEKEPLLRASYGPNYDRFVALKAQYDPTNLFRMNQNIKPAA